MGFFSGGFSGVASGIGGVASGIGNYLSNKQAMAFSKEQFEWQKNLALNQLQWRVADAKKAGLHPMAALGIGASSFSPVGVSQSPYDFSWIGDMGQNADYAAAKAKDKQDQDTAVNLSRRNVELQNQNLELQNQGLQQDNDFRQWQYNAAMSGGVQQALKSPANASVNGVNPSVIPGQDDSIPPGKGNVPSGDPMYQFMETSTPGVFTLQPGNDWSQVFEDKGFPFEQWPLFKSNVVDYAGRATGRIINGMVYSDAAGGWVRANSKLGKEALDTLSSRARHYGRRWWNEMKNAVRFYSR